MRERKRKKGKKRDQRNSDCLGSMGKQVKSLGGSIGSEAQERKNCESQKGHWVFSGRAHELILLFRRCRDWVTFTFIGIKEERVQRV